MGADASTVSGRAVPPVAAGTATPGRILHVLWNMEIGGAERALFQFVREQRSRGMHADVLLGSHAGLYGERTREIGAMVHELGMSGPFDFARAKRARAIMREYAVMHFHSAELGLMHIAAQRPHPNLFYTHRAGMFSYDLKRLLRYKLSGWYLRRHFAGISGNTSQACDAASKLFGIERDRIRVTYNGIDFSLLDPVRSPREMLDLLKDERGDIIRVGTSANLRRLKRIDLLLDAIARLAHRPVHCYVLGDGPALAELQAQAARLGIADRVTFTGKVERMGDYLQLFDMFVLPSGPEESFGNSAVEAMGVGIPTIVFADGGGLLEHVDNGVTGYVVRDVPELAARLDMLAADPLLRRTIGDAARREMLDRYSPERMVERYSRLYGVAGGR